MNKKIIKKVLLSIMDTILFWGCHPILAILDVISVIQEDKRKNKDIK